MDSRNIKDITEEMIANNTAIKSIPAYAQNAQLTSLWLPDLLNKANPYIAPMTVKTPLFWEK